jgi:hypothetical protein
MNIHDIAKQIRSFADELEAAKPEKPDEIPWITWHGGECPLKDEEVEEWEWRVRSSLETGKITVQKPSSANWSHTGSLGDIIAYRVLKWREPKPKAPLGPEDVPPFSVFRVKGEGSTGWHQMELCPQWEGLAFSSDVSLVSYKELKRNWLINRSIPTTGKWNPDAWENCEK